MVDCMAAEHLELAAYGGRHVGIAEVCGIFHPYPQDRIAVELGCTQQSRDDRANPRRGGESRHLHTFVPASGVVIDMSRLQPVQEAFVELKDVAKVPACPVWFEPARRLR